jgi:HIV Tat-specific factor 1
MILDLKEDIREGCEKLGEVTNVVLYDQEEDGVATVRFKDIEGAQACVQVSNTLHCQSIVRQD